MRQLIIYTELQMKKVLRTYPAMLLMTFLLALILGAMLYLQSSKAANTMTGDEDSKAAIGIVGSDSSPYLKMGIRLLQNLDPSKVAVRFKQLSHKDALASLKKGKLNAVIIIPEGLTDKLLSGDVSSKMTLILPDSGASLEPLLIRELSACVSVIIGQMESASNALADFYTASGVTSAEDISDAQTDLLYMSIRKLLSRSQMFTLRRMKTAGTLTIESYYLCAMFLLLVLLTGVMCAGNYIRTDHSIEVLLHIRGFHAFSQIVSEYLSLVLFMLLLGAVFMPASGLGLSKMPIVFSELSSGTHGFFRNYLFFSLKAFPVVLMAAALDLLLYELADSLISGVLLQFLASVLLAYLSGVFYPLSSLPSAIRVLSPYLPTGQAMLYLRKSLIRGNSILIPLVYLLTETAVFILLAICLRKRKLSWSHA